MSDVHRSASEAPSRWLAPWRRSLRLRILTLVLLVVLGTISAMALYVLRQFEEASVLHLQHEGLMLSDVLEAAIIQSVEDDPDPIALQALVDRIAANRDRNDIEINIMLLEGHRSSTVASNIHDNVETNSVYEHRDLLAALERNEPVVFVGRDDDSSSELPAPVTSPDHYLRPGERFISISTPLVIHGNGVGCINTKLSLSEIDQRLSRIRAGILLLGASLPAMALVLFLWAIQRGLRPLHHLAGEIAQVGSSRLDHRFSDEAVPTELQPIVTRLNELLNRIESAFHRERRFTSNAAHELRTPIASLKTLAEVGLQGMSEAPRDDELLLFFQDTLAIAMQMEHLVVNLLGLVRCESGLEVTVSSFDLRGAIDEAWEMHRPQAEERGLHAEISLDGQAMVESDQTLMSGVLRNLFANAVSHTESSGSVRCTLERGGDHFRCVFTNTNDSLAREDLEHLFEPFWRKEEARSDSSHCGLGLSLVAAYARLLSIGMEVDLPTPDLFEIRLRIPVRWESNTSV